MQHHTLITGGSGGIGGATAKLLAANGNTITLVARESGRKNADALASAICESGGEALVVIADMSREEDIVTAFNTASERFGPPTGVVNSAGIVHTSLVQDLDYSETSRMMSVNVIGLMICCREAVRHMTSNGGGSIVNISSMAATIGGRPGASVYAASKGAVDTFSTGFAREVARAGIRVNTIRPGVIATKMTANLESNPELKKSIEASIPMGRLGQAEEIAEVVSWLLSPAASLVTGAHINAGGGGFHVAASM